MNFDWLFGSPRQTNQQGLDDANKARDEANLAAARYYFDNDDWNTGTAKQYAQLSQAADNSIAAADQYKSAFDQEEKSTRHDYFGNGMLGALLNPFAQTATAGFDLATGNYGDRDVMSDLGALGQSLLTAVPFAGAATRVGKAALSVPGMAGLGAGFGGLEELRQGGSDTQFQDVLAQSALGAGFGAAIPIGGKMLRNRGSKILSRDMANREMDPAAISQAMSAIPNKALYSTALRSFVPKSTFGKVAAGGGAILGANALMGGGQPQAQTGGNITDEELYNYLISQGMM